MVQTAQAEERREKERSEEQLDIFSRGAENTTAQELAVAYEEDTNNICFVDLWDQLEALEGRIKMQGLRIQQVKLEMDEEGMGDHDDLPNGQNFFQLRRLQELDQPREQLDELIEDINRMMLGSVQTTSKEKLGGEKAATEATQRKQQQQQNRADGKLQRLIWDPGGFPNNYRGSS
jgi:hypothetical protein